MKWTIGTLMVFILGCVASQLAGRMIAPAHAAAGTPKWEYRCTGDSAHRIADMNDLGAQGWELVAGASRGVSGGQIAGETWASWCFKRALP